jgi:methyltransferase (TIGR00027 family)
MSAVGTTAQWIAAARALETESDSALFNDPFARILAGDAGFAMLDEVRRSMGPMGGAVDSSRPDPYLSIRTRFLDDGLLQAVTGGIRQVVILAAGMDTRAFRLDFPAGTVLFEVDRDDVWAWKEPVLKNGGAAPRCDRRVVHADLAAEWVPALTAAGFDATLPTAFLVEGLLMYLDAAAVDRLFASLAALAADGSWLGLDLVNAEMLSSPFAAPYMKKLADLGCPWHFGTSEPEEFLARHGWHGSVVMPGAPEANYGRWPFPPLPRTIPGIPRTFYASVTKGGAAAAEPGPISTAAAERYEWGAGAEGWHLVRRETLSVIQERMPPGTSEVRHRHLAATQFFFVLQGELEIEVAGATHRIAAGAGLEVRPGVPHQVFNRSASPADFLVVSQPPSHGDREPAPAD